MIPPAGVSLGRRAMIPGDFRRPSLMTAFCGVSVCLRRGMWSAYEVWDCLELQQGQLLGGIGECVLQR